jgi:membrane protein implicated in regulation of membrane protease activity
MTFQQITEYAESHPFIAVLLFIAFWIALVFSLVSTIWALLFFRKASREMEARFSRRPW